MRSELPYSPDELVNAINRLLATHFVEIYKNPNGSVVFKETRNVDISRCVPHAGVHMTSPRPRTTDAQDEAERFGVRRSGCKS